MFRFCFFVLCIGFLLHNSAVFVDEGEKLFYSTWIQGIFATTL